MYCDTGDIRDSRGAALSSSPPGQRPIAMSSTAPLAGLEKLQWEASLDSVVVCHHCCRCCLS